MLKWGRGGHFILLNWTKCTNLFSLIVQHFSVWDLKWKFSLDFFPKRFGLWHEKKQQQKTATSPHMVLLDTQKRLYFTSLLLCWWHCCHCAIETELFCVGHKSPCRLPTAADCRELNSIQLGAIPLGDEPKAAVPLGATTTYETTSGIHRAAQQSGKLIWKHH